MLRAAASIGKQVIYTGRREVIEISVSEGLPTLTGNEDIGDAMI